MSINHHPWPVWSPAACLSGFCSALWPAGPSLLGPCQPEPGSSLSSVSNSFSFLASIMAGREHLMATEWSSCFNDRGFEQSPCRLNIKNIAGRWQMKSFWSPVGVCSLSLKTFGPAVHKCLIQLIYWHSSTIPFFFQILQKKCMWP